jgi:dethiobiotin synthetase
MPALFVTATGTDVGKTFVASGLIRAYRRAGRAVAALKPVVSGSAPDDPLGDTRVLLDALGRPATPDTIAALSPWRFKAPLSPDMAAALEGRAIAVADVLAACRAATQPDRLTIIEGAGGVMVPLAPGETFLDLMRALGAPILLVSPTALGAISHLLCALAALDARGLSPATIVLNETPGSTVPLAMMIETLAGFGLADRIVALRRPARDLDHAFDALLAHLDARAASHPD